MSKAVDVLIVSNHDRIKGACRQIASWIWGNEINKFQITEKVDGNKHQWFLSFDQQLNLNFQEKNYKLSPFYQNKTHQYYLEPSVLFLSYRAKYILISVSLIVFKKIEGELKPLFRAEWHKPTNENLLHAQPHWHIYEHKEEFSKDNAPFDQTLLETFGDEFPANENKTVKQTTSMIEDIHFSMNSWIMKEESYKHDFGKQEELKNWLTGCTTYVKQQLEYISQ